MHYLTLVLGISELVYIFIRPSRVTFARASFLIPVTGSQVGVWVSSFRNPGWCTQRSRIIRLRNWWRKALNTFISPGNQVMSHGFTEALSYEFLQLSRPRFEAPFLRVNSYEICLCVPMFVSKWTRLCSCVQTTQFRRPAFACIAFGRPRICVCVCRTDSAFWQVWSDAAKIVL